MAKVSFGKTVKYDGIIYPPNQVFEVKDEDVLDLVKSGAWVKEEPKAVEPAEEEIKEEKSELEILREQASKLGIDYKGNWGVKKLTEAIEKLK